MVNCESVAMDKKMKVAWIIAIILFVFILFSYCYCLDTVSIVRYELSFADSLVHGQIFNFYQKTYDVMQVFYPSHSPTYDLPMNLVLGIWGIPLYFISQAKGLVDVGQSFISLCYGKTLLLVATFIATWLIKKICAELGLSEKKSWYGAFMFFTSLLVLSCTAVVGQTDIVGIVPALAGVLAYVRRKDWQFLLWFVLAYPFKQFSFFVFIPLLLARQKNILKIAAQTLLVVGFTFICNLPLRNCPKAYEFKTMFSANMLYQLTNNKLPLVNGVSSMVVLWGIVCVFAYLHKYTKNVEDENQFTIFIMLASMVSVFISFPSNCYWYVNLAPYVVLAIIYGASQTRYMLLFETIGFGALTASGMIINYWCYDVENCTQMLVGQIFRGDSFNGEITLQTLVQETLIGKAAPVLQAIYVVCMLALLWLTWRNRRRKNNNFTQNDMLMRAGVNYLAALAPLFLFIIGMI